MSRPPESSPGLSFQQTAQRAGISPRILDHWTRQGYVSPESRSLAKSGFPRHYGPDEACVIETMARLVRAGFRPDAAVTFARLLMSRHEIIIGSGIRLIVDNP